jgi:hypothetical protein
MLLGGKNRKIFFAEALSWGNSKHFPNIRGITLWKT